MGTDWLLVQPLHHVEYGVRIGENTRNVGLTEPDHTLFVDDDHGPVAGPALFVPQSVRSGGVTYGVEVGQLGVGQTTQCRGPSTVGRNGVATDAQNLGIIILEQLVVLAERGCLSGSTSCEVEYVEGKNDYLVALIIAKRNVPIGGRELEIRGYIANFCRHIPAFLIEIWAPLRRSVFAPSGLYRRIRRETSTGPLQAPCD